MMGHRNKYIIITIIFVLLCFFFFSVTDLKNNIHLSLVIEIVFILYLLRLIYGCILYVQDLYHRSKYSYSIVMNIGLILFLAINILRLTTLLIKNWHNSTIIDIYNNTIHSFSYFAMLTLPFIIILSIYSVITNIVLIRKEGFHYYNLLGIGLGFLSLIGLFGNQAVYVITNNIFQTSSQLLFKKFFDISLNATLSYLYCVMIATLYCNIMAANHNPAYDKDYIIILGSKIRKDGTLTPLLRGRVDRAIKFAKEQKKISNKEIIYVPSGGKGNDEMISEAEAMKNYLIEKGISKDAILIENESTSTVENMRFSRDVIRKRGQSPKIAYSTTDYHVFRSGIIASKEGIDCEGMGSKTKWYFYTNALIREFMANLFSEKK